MNIMCVDHVCSRLKIRADVENVAEHSVGNDCGGQEAGKLHVSKRCAGDAITMVRCVQGDDGPLWHQNSKVRTVVLEDRAHAFDHARLLLAATMDVVYDIGAEVQVVCSIVLEEKVQPAAVWHARIHVTGAERRAHAKGGGGRQIG